MQSTMAGVTLDVVERTITYKRNVYGLPAKATVRVEGKYKFIDVAGDGWEFTARFRMAPIEQIEMFAERISRAGSW